MPPPPSTSWVLLQGAGVLIPDALAGQTLTPGVYNLGRGPLGSGNAHSQRPHGRQGSSSSGRRARSPPSTPRLIAGSGEPLQRVLADRQLRDHRLDEFLWKHLRQREHHGDSAHMIGRAIAGTGAVTLPVRRQSRSAGCATPARAGPDAAPDRRMGLSCCCSWEAEPTCSAGARPRRRADSRAAARSARADRATRRASSEGGRHVSEWREVGV